MRIHLDHLGTNKGRLPTMEICSRQSPNCMINDPYHNGTQRPNGIYRLWKLLINGAANDWQKWPSIVPLNNFGFHFPNDLKFLLIIVFVRVPVCITSDCFSSMKAIWVSTTTAASLEANKTQDKLLLSRRKWAVSKGELSSNYPPRLPRSVLCFMCFSTSANFPQGTMQGMSGMLNKDKKFPQRVRTLNLLLAQRATFQLDFRLERKFCRVQRKISEIFGKENILEGCENVIGRANIKMLSQATHDGIDNCPRATALGGLSQAWWSDSHIVLSCCCHTRKMRQSRTPQIVSSFVKCASQQRSGLFCCVACLLEAYQTRIHNFSLCDSLGRWWIIMTKI